MLCLHALSHSYPVPISQVCRALPGQMVSALKDGMLSLQTSCVTFRSWLYDMCRGIEHEPVRPRYLPQSIGCSKNFPGKTALATQQQVGEQKAS